MSANVDSAPSNAAPPVASFFRQSGWLMIANVVAGALMWAVHFLNKYLPTGEYGKFGAFVAVVTLLPTIPLQMVLAQQTAKAIAEGREREVTGLIHAAWLGTTLLWLAGAVVVLLLQKNILEAWHLQSPVGLWITLAIMLFTLWQPVFWGVMQGQQNFLWLGWSVMATGLGRLSIAALAVWALHAGSTGMMVGVLAGIAASTGIAAWQARGLWCARAVACDWRGVVKQILPLTLGFLGFQLLFSADTILVKAYFSETDVDVYVSAGTLSRALMWLVLPLAAVMFPRLVHSAAKAEKSNLPNLVLVATAILAVVGALGLALLGPWIVGIVYKKETIEAVSALLPWYAAAVVPLAVGNVLLNNLLARPAATLIPAGCILGVAVAYVVALTQFHGSLVTVLQVLGLGNLGLLAACAWFTYRRSPTAGTAA